MRFTGFYKKETAEKAEPKCVCSGSAEVYTAPGCCESQSTDGCRTVITSMKVLGLGCKSCREQYENAGKAAEDLGLGIEVDYCTQMEQVMQYGVMSMPAIVVNERVISSGKVLKPAELAALLQKMGYCAQ